MKFSFLGLHEFDEVEIINCDAEYESFCIRFKARG